MSNGRSHSTFVSRARSSAVPPDVRIQYLRDLMAFFGVRFKIQPPKPTEDYTPSPGEVVVSCVGVGFSNVNKAMA